MQKEVRLVFYDEELKIEAFHFAGLRQKFPPHFHEHYVLGGIKKGKRLLIQDQQKTLVGEEKLLLFNPEENHACEPVGESPLTYYCLNITKPVMLEITQELSGVSFLPNFTQAVVESKHYTKLLEQIYLLILNNKAKLKKEELFYFLLESLLTRYAQRADSALTSPVRPEFQAACAYMEGNFRQNITLSQLAKLTNLSKYYFLRSFVKEKGITPYRYLETIRINQATRLLKKLVSPQEAALQAGFSDQSHFTNFFKEFTGLTPKQYLRIFKEEPEIES